MKKVLIAVLVVCSVLVAGTAQASTTEVKPSLAYLTAKDGTPSGCYATWVSSIKDPPLNSSMLQYLSCYRIWDRGRFAFSVYPLKEDGTRGDLISSSAITNRHVRNTAVSQPEWTCPEDMVSQHLFVLRSRVTVWDVPERVRSSAVVDTVVSVYCPWPTTTG